MRFGIALAAPDLACRRALSRLGIARMIFGTALAAPDLDGFVTDGTRCGYLMTCADALEITPLESPANRGTAIMQGAILLRLSHSRLVTPQTMAVAVRFLF